MSRYLALFLVGLTCPSCLCAENVRFQNERKFEQAWKKIQQSTPKKKLEDEASYWLEASFSACHVFREQHRLDKTKVDWAKYFVARFGKDGDAADLHWLLVCPHYTLPICGTHGLSKSDRESWDLVLRLCEYQTKRLVSDEKFLKRYYHALLWSQRFFRANGHQNFFGLNLSLVRKRLHELKNEKHEDYWWWARSFVILLYATGRQDLIKELRFEELTKQFDMWEKWIQKNQGRFILAPDSLSWTVDKSPSLKLKKMPDLKLPEKPFLNIDQFPTPAVLMEAEHLLPM